MDISIDALVGLLLIVFLIVIFQNIVLALYNSKIYSTIKKVEIKLDDIIKQQLKIK